MIGPKVNHHSPVSSLIAYWIGRIVLWVYGWHVIGDLPEDKKYILIGGPHTSTWDFPIGMAALYVFRLKISWIGKHTLFHWPYGWFMRWLGGMPVDRESPTDIVDQLTKKIHNADKLVLVIAPSGTRKKKNYWKSGFYRIATNAKVPIVCGYLDFNKKEACIGLRLLPTGNVKEDMDLIRGFYHGVQGKHPEKVTQVKLSDESKRIVW